MKRLVLADLLSLEHYARERAAFRRQVMAHKRKRQLSVGPHTLWLFEDRLTVQYQIQEMLRAERIFEPEGIAAELDAYNPLIPDGSNWKVTLLIEFPDPAERQRRLIALKGLEDACWVQIEGHAKVFAVADEDLERENAEKTSAVHFLRFELHPEAIGNLGRGAALALGVDHDEYRHAVQPVPDEVRRALCADFFESRRRGCGVSPGALPVEGIDAWWERAVTAGAQIVTPLQAMFWGDRCGQLKDPYGVL